MRIPKPARIGIAGAALAIGLFGSGKSLYRGIQSIGEARDHKTSGAERMLDIEDNVLPIDDRDSYLEHRQDVQVYDSLLADTTNMENVGRYEVHNTSAGKSLKRNLPLYLLLSLAGGIGTWIEGSSWYASMRERSKRKKASQKA